MSKKIFSSIKLMAAVLFAQLIFLPSANAFEVYGAIGEKWRSLGGAGSFLGQPISAEGDISGGGRIQHFQGGNIVWHPMSGAQTIYGLIYDKWISLGGTAYGYPITDELPAARGGRYNDFIGGGSIYWSYPTGAHAIYGDIKKKWQSLGAESSFLKYPSSDELPLPNGGRKSEFEGGDIVWHPRLGAYAVYGEIRLEWLRKNGVSGVCGFPISDEHDFDDGRDTGEYSVGKRFRRSQFENGSIVWSKKRARIEEACDPKPNPNTEFQTTEDSVCAGNIPAGWIKVDDKWDPEICGKPSQISYNVWKIKRIDNLTTGTTMKACLGVVPDGWLIIDRQWDPTACGHPSMNYDNVMKIRRVR